MQKIKHSHFRLRLCTHTHKHIFLYYYNIFACNYVIFLQILCRMHFTVSLENSDASEPFLYYSQFQTESVLVYLWQNSTSLMVNVIFQWLMNHWSGENIWTTKVCPVTLHYAPALGSCIVCTAEISQFCLVVSCFSTPIHRCIPFVTHQFFLHSLLSLYNIFKQHICASHIKTIILNRVLIAIILTQWALQRNPGWCVCECLCSSVLFWHNSSWSTHIWTCAAHSYRGWHTASLKKRGRTSFSLSVQVVQKYLPLSQSTGHAEKDQSLALHTHTAPDTGLLTQVCVLSGRAGVSVTSTPPSACSRTVTSSACVSTTPRAPTASAAKRASRPSPGRLAPTCRRPTDPPTPVRMTQIILSFSYNRISYNHHLL